MLDKLVIQIKNIIFFKLVMYLICIILFIALIPKFQNQLTKSLVRKAKSEILLNKSITQLESATLCDAQMLLNVLDNSDTIKPSQQSKAGVLYAHKVSKEESAIDWTEIAFAIDCKVRGMNTWLGIYFEHQDKEST